MEMATNLAEIHDNGFDKKQIVKSNSLIESSYKLTVSEQRLIYLGSSLLNIRMIDKDLTVEEVTRLIHTAMFEPIHIDVPTFKKVFGIKAKSIYKDIKETVERLYDRDLVYVDTKGKIVHKRWVITCKYDDECKCIDLQFHPDLIRDLLVFKDKYTIMNLSDTKNIKSNYTYRFYELLKQYEKFGIRVFELEDLKFKLGIDDEEYPRYSNFKQRVLNPSIKELNNLTDLDINIQEIKQKNKVVKLKCFINPKNVAFKKIVDNEVCVTDTEDSIITDLQDILNYNITAGQAKKLVEKGLEAIEKFKLDIDLKDYIKEKKKIVDAYGKNKHIKSYLGAIIKAVQENWETIQVQQSIFNNFQQREYDFKDLEKKLLGWD